MKKTMTLLALLLGLVFSAGAATLLTEDFNYTAGTNLTSNGWVAHSAAGTTPITINNGGLSFSNFSGNDIGNAALVTGTGEDLNKTFTSQTNATIYAGFMLKLNQLPTTSGYFFHLAQSDIAGTSFKGRVFLATDGRLGISQQSSTPTYYSAPLIVGNTYFIVLKYELVAGSNNDIAHIFILDSTIPTTEPSPNATSSDTPSDPTNIGAVCIRQANGYAKYVLDGITVATTWAEAVRAPQGLSGTKTVGTDGNYATLAAARDDLINKGVSGAVNFNLTDATYDLGSTSLSIGNITGTSATNTVTIKPATGVTTSITGSVEGALIDLNGADYVTIDGQGRNLTITNNILSSSTFSTAVNIISNANNNTITSCVISAQCGIQIAGNSNSIVSNNKIVNNFEFPDNTKSVYGIILSNATNAKIQNNMIVLSPTGGIVNFNGIASSISTSDIYNNSIYLGGTATVGANSAAFVHNSPATPTLVSSNIFYNNRTDNTAYAVSAYGTTYTNILQDNNLFYSEGENLCRIDEANSTFSNWKSTSGLDNNSQNTPVTFEAAAFASGELKYERAAANSAVFNTGDNTGVTTDFYGIARPQYADYDIGAYELPQSSDLSETTLPTVNTLAQNYPNPFNPETTIGFTLAKNATVNLTVYNTRGEVVKSLINNSLNAGFHSVNFNAVGLNSGVYVYKLTTPDNSITKKMILLK